MSIVLNSAGGGSITLNEPNTASNRVLELPNNSGTLISTGSTFAGNGPAFMAESSVDQSVTSATWTKVTLGNEIFDTDSCFASSRFTPTVAGYYQFNGIVRAVSASNNVTNVSAGIYKNGALYAAAGTTSAGASGLTTSVPSLVYLNGSTDYVELYGSVTGTSPSFDYTSAGVAPQLSGCLVRAA
jgi:hypothetical protein